MTPKVMPLAESITSPNYHCSGFSIVNGVGYLNYDRNTNIKYFWIQVFNLTRPKLKDLQDCGKRYIRESSEKQFGECYWNCEVNFD